MPDAPPVMIAGVKGPPEAISDVIILLLPLRLVPAGNRR
jgi:hypothetical protein